MNVYLDVEASGFGGYPIEVAWCAEDLSAAGSWLIKPEDWPPHLEWHDSAEAVHGLTHDRLVAEGLPASMVADRLAGDLAAADAVYSDNPRFDFEWLSELYALESLKAVPFHIQSAPLVMPLLRYKGLSPVVGHIAEQAGLVGHRALDDCLRQAIAMQVFAGRSPTGIEDAVLRLMALHGRDRSVNAEAGA